MPSMEARPDEFVVSPAVPSGAVTVLRATGRMHAKGAQSLHRQCAELRALGHQHIAVVLSDVTFVSSSGVGVFLASTEEFRHVGGSFHLVAPSPAVEAVIDLLNLRRFLAIAPDVSAVAQTVGS